MVVAPSLEIFKIYGDVGVNNLIKWHVVLPMAEGIGLDDLWWSLPTKLFCDSFKKCIIVFVPALEVH